MRNYWQCFSIYHNYYGYLEQSEMENTKINKIETKKKKK